MPTTFTNDDGPSCPSCGQQMLVTYTFPQGVTYGLIRRWEEEGVKLSDKAVSIVEQCSACTYQVVQKGELR